MILGSLLVRQTGPHNNIYIYKYIKIVYNESYIHIYTQKGERGARSDMNKLSFECREMASPNTTQYFHSNYSTSFGAKLSGTKNRLYKSI